MARYRINPNIRFYLPGDPYYYEVDNLPLKDLDANDKSLQEQIDNINKRLDLGLDDVGRNGFVELMPYFDEKVDGSIRVKKGNFIARINTKADLENGLMERKFGSDADSVSVSLTDPMASQDLPRINAAGRDNAEIYQAKAAARTAVVEYEDLDSLGIPTFNNDDFTDSDAPDFRIDLLYIQASPGMDETNNVRPRFGNIQDTARLGYLKGGYFRMDEYAGRNVGEILSTDGLAGKVAGLSQVDVAGREVGTVPAPDDIVNGSYKSPDTATGFVSHTPGISPISLDLWAERQMDNLGVFCLPVAYVKVPRGYRAGEVLPDESIIDIRPFFRSTELTLSERQAIATSHSPSLNNRFMTLTDPDYVHLKDVTVKGQGLALRQDHEGRITRLEEQMRGNAGIDIYQPTHVECLEGQELAPYYTDNIDDFTRDFVTGDFPNTHKRRNNETYKKTVRAMRHRISEGVYMLYVQMYFDLADEAASRYDQYGEDQNIRQGSRSNNPQYPLPSGYYRLDVTKLGFTGASVESIICTPNLEQKTGGAAVCMDIFRQSDYIEDGSGEARGAFIDFQFSCKDKEERSDYNRWRDWFGGDDGYKHSVTHGTATVSVTLQGLSNVVDLYDGLPTSEDGFVY
tara:strand:- start:4031 stop:5914 length:1884 start_codon:yes stop_codon:yes gene_type:complete